MADLKTGLAGRHAVVTGAASGLGRATTCRLASDGASVSLIDIDREGVEMLARDIGPGALAHTVDVRDRAGIAMAIESSRRALGPVAILVNNAGVAGNNASLEAIDDAAYERMFSIHVKGALNMVQAVMDDMKTARFGRIVNVASNRGQVGFERSCHYSAAKAALIAFAKSWARELAPWGIRVNALAPGVIRTAMTLAHGEDAVRAEADLNLLKRWAEPEEIAATIAFLVGPEGDFFTGQLLCPNGGDPIVGI